MSSRGFSSSVGALSGFQNFVSASSYFRTVNMPVARIQNVAVIGPHETNGDKNRAEKQVTAATIFHFRSNRFGSKDRVDRITVQKGSCQLPLQKIVQCAITPRFSTSVAVFFRSLITNVLFSPSVDHGPRGTSLKSTNRQSVTSVLCSPR